MSAAMPPEDFSDIAAALIRVQAARRPLHPALALDSERPGYAELDPIGKVLKRELRQRVLSDPA